MNQILSTQQAIQVSQKLQENKEKLVLTGGCFDILHMGHFALLENAKKQGNVLMVLLESDEKIKKLKGELRPLHNQEQRARMLSSLRFVDYVILLPFLETDSEYDKLIEQLKPSVIAVTENDPYEKQKKRQAKKIGAQVREVTPYIPEKSTSQLMKTLLKEK